MGTNRSASLQSHTVGNKVYYEADRLAELLGVSELLIVDYMNEQSPDKPVVLLSEDAAAHLCDLLQTKRAKTVKARLGAHDSSLKKVRGAA